jgi:hypothetical protein
MVANPIPPDNSTSRQQVAYHVDAIYMLTISQQIGVETSQRVRSCLRIARVDQAQVQQLSFALIDVGDQFASLDHSHSAFCLATIT